MGWGEGGMEGRGKREIIYLSLHCQRAEGSGGWGGAMGGGGGERGDYVPIATLSPPE